MSAIPLKADIRLRRSDVRYVPQADIRRVTRSPRRRELEAWAARVVLFFGRNRGHNQTRPAVLDQKSR